jgi:hypothetical protein
MKYLMFWMFLIFSFALATNAAAQGGPQELPKVALKPATAPQFAGVFHPSTGFQGSSGKSPRSGPDSIFNCMVLSNYYSTPGTNQEWIDEGILRDRNANLVDQMNGFQFVYCSSDTNANGITATFTFYEENIYCQGPPNWPTANCAYEIGGIPGGANGNLACWQIQIDLCGFECDLPTNESQAQLFGWGCYWDNNTSGPWIASGGYGSECMFVWYDTNQPNANSGFQGCFWFGCLPFESFAIEMFGNPPESFSYSSAAGPGIDDSLCLLVDTQALPNGSLTFSVLDGPFGQLAPSTIWSSRNQVDNHLQASFGIDAHELAEYRSRLWTNISPTGTHTGTLPPNVAGHTFYTQAATGQNGTLTALSNALAQTIY